MFDENVPLDVVTSVWEVAPAGDYLPGEGPGGFRLHNILPFTNGMTPAPFTDIHPRITGWLQMANSEPPSGVHLMEHIAKTHAGFERIHPFRDGNGRTGRLTMNLILVRRGYAPAIICKRDRPRYLRRVRSATRSRRDNGMTGGAIMIPHDADDDRAILRREG